MTIRAETARMIEQEADDRASAARARVLTAENEAAHWKAEVARAHSLLREAIPFINDAGDDEDPEAQSRANDLFVRIAAALNNEQSETSK